MAQFEDYLLRQISRFAAAIRSVLKAREEDPDAEIEAIGDGLRSLVGLTVETLGRMPPDAVRPFFLDGDRIEADKAIAVAWLVQAAADLQTEVGAAHQLRVAAVGIHALALDAGPADPDSAAQLEDLVRRVHLTQLPPATLARLLPHFESRDQFDRAEDVVFAWVKVDAEGGLAAGRGLYERLWSLPDARLKAGGLSSEEVLEGLAELERVGGRRLG